MLAIPTTHPRLAAALRAHVYVERLRSARDVLLHVAALAGGLTWLCAAWPTVLPPWGRTLAMATVPACLGVLGLLVILERRGNARMVRLVQGVSPGAEGGELTKTPVLD
jgi:hypothetical protein